MACSPRTDVHAAVSAGTVAYEHFTASIYGAPAEPYTLRVTHVYRREDGEWKLSIALATRFPPVPSARPRNLASTRDRQAPARCQ